VDEVIEFALLGLGIGAAYALSAIGIVVVYRGSGVVNFAQGAIASAAAFVTWRELYEHKGWPFLAAFAVGMLLAAGIGVATQVVVMQVLRRASALARTVATLGVLVMVQSYLGQVYGNELWLVLTPLPDGRVEPFGRGIGIPQDRLWLTGIAVLLTAALWAMYRWTNFGRATTAVAESQEIASSLGWSPNFIAAVNWGLGCGLGGMAGILISPIIGLNVGALTNLLLASLAAALVAGFRSLPITLAAGMGLGVLRSELTRFTPELGLPDQVDLAGLPDTLPFLVIIVVLVISGSALPVRGFVHERLPKIGAGRIRPGVIVPLAVVLAVLILQINSAPWQGAVVSTMGLAVILLSAVVIVGYAGQISLAQFALAGFGAWVAARLIVDTGMPFEVATLLAILAGVAMGVVFALPAVRVRGVRLAIITFGLGTALHRMLFANVPLTGGRTGLDVGPRSIFGIDIDPIRHQERYAAFVFVVFTLVAIAVANVRRGRAGRRLIAVRANERAAAAMGISAWAVKVYAFGLSSAIAALGGVLLFFKTSPIVFEYIFPSRSITALTTAVIGGIGYVLGPLIGALWLPGSVGARFVGDVLGVPTEWLAFVGGAFVLLIIMRHQDGAADTFTRAGRAIGARITAGSERGGQPGPVLSVVRRLGGHTAGGEIEEIKTAARGVRKHRVTPRHLEIRDLTVSYGGITAVRNVSMSIEPGQIVGLIGPNGAGKTTLVDAVTGFVKYTGEVVLEGRRLDRLPAHRRARAGMTRSFQNLEIFEDLTVAENLRTASDPGGALPYFADIVYPKHLPLSEAALACIDEFNIGPLLGRLPTELSYGQRRLVGIARSVATAPSVLLLDEPASGLVEWSSMELATLVRRLATDWGMGILVIEHDIRFVMTACDSVMALDFGREISFGSPEAVRHDPAVVAAYLGDVDEIRPGQAARAGAIVKSESAAAGLAGAHPERTS
jgi:ABC-type branched-subunit amino acid transport system ATPase component/branched-subunit amino acid ABC-type transport system permease component